MSPRLCLLSSALLVLAGCVATPPRDESAIRGEIQRLEARLAQLERGAAAAPAAPAAAHGVAPDARQQPQAAFERLATGNAAFAGGRPRSADVSPARVRELASGQRPYAVVVACSDSRTPPEHLFAAGLGDLFVVRCAGNVIDEAAVASVEYAVAHLGCRLVVVLGHTSCGAVKAAIAKATDTPAVAALVGRITPAVESARPGPADGHADRAASANARLQRDTLLGDSKLLAGLAHERELNVITARYDLTDGTIDWLDVDRLALPTAGSANVPASAPAKPASAAPAHGH